MVRPRRQKIIIDRKNAPSEVFLFLTELLKASKYILSSRNYLVVAQVNEWWHSVQAGRVCIPLRRCFFRCRIGVYSLWALGFFLLKCNRTRQASPSSFLFPIIMYHCKICQSTKQQGKINPKTGWERSKYKKEDFSSLSCIWQTIVIFYLSPWHRGQTPAVEYEDGGFNPSSKVLFSSLIKSKKWVC